MQADENPSEGDLAVVYSEGLQAWDGSSKIMTLTFPKTVVLSSASTGRCYGDYYVNGYITMQGNVSSTSAEFNIYTSYGNISYTITYTSTDGLTYTRTDTYTETITIADEFITMSMSSWNAICGYFMQIPSYYFGGIYEYSTYFNKKKFATYTNFGYDTSFKKELDGYIAIEDLIKLQNFVLETASNTLNVLVVKTRENPNILTGYTYDYGESTHYTSELCIIDGVIHPGWKTTGSYTTTIHKYTLNLDTNETSSSSYTATTGSYTVGSSTFNIYYGSDIIPANAYVTAMIVGEEQPKLCNVQMYANTTSSSVALSGSYYLDLGYIIAPTQLTASADDIAPGYTGFGSDGIVEGTYTSDATAGPNDIISPKTAYVNGQKITGTMPNNGALNYTPSEQEQTIPAGYTSGGTVNAIDYSNTLTPAEYTTALDTANEILTGMASDM